MSHTFLLQKNGNFSNNNMLKTDYFLNIFKVVILSLRSDLRTCLPEATDL